MHRLSSSQRLFPSLGWLALAAALLAAGGCSVMRPVQNAVVGSSSSSDSQLSQPQLQEQLGIFYVEFVNGVDRATTVAASQTDDLNLRENLLEARLRLVRKAGQIIFQRNPVSAFVDTWTVCLQLRYYLATEEARQRFGPATESLALFAAQLNTNVETLGRLFLKPQQLADARIKLDAFAREHPASGSQDAILPSDAAASGIPQLGWLFEIPLSPFRAFQGVDQTAQAVNEVAMVGAQFTRVTQSMPRELEWNSELLLLKIQIAANNLVANIDNRQTNLQATLGLARQTLVEASNTLARAEPVVRDAERTAVAIGNAGDSLNAVLKTYTSMVLQLYPPDTNAPVDTNSPPFNILDYAKTADNIATAAGQLQGVLIQFQKTMETNAISIRLNEAQAAVSNAETSARKLVDHIAWRVVQVVLAFFAALTAYRLLTRKPPGAPAAPAS
ncbi:MAG: hypothetical protein U1F98_03015 [Verrucomicrobiota bacterium]